MIEVEIGEASQKIFVQYHLWMALNSKWLFSGISTTGIIG